MGLPVEMMDILQKETVLWNGASYSEVMLRDRWIEAQPALARYPVIEPDGTYLTYNLYLRQQEVSPVRIGTVFLHRQEVLIGGHDDMYLVESAFGTSNITFTGDNVYDQKLIGLYKQSPKFTDTGSLDDLPGRTRFLSEKLIDLYNRSPKRVADTILRELNWQKRRALSMAFHPRLGAAAAINMLDDDLIDKIFEYCEVHL